MSIIKIQIQKREPGYVMIDNKAIFDERLSLKATGLLARLLARPSDWKPNISHLTKTMPDGRDAIYSALHELASSGYAKLEVRRGANGRVVSQEWIVSEQPVFAPPTSSLTGSGKAGSGKSGSGKPPTNNTESNKTELSNNTDIHEDPSFGQDFPPEESNPTDPEADFLYDGKEDSAGEAPPPTLNEGDARKTKPPRMTYSRLYEVSLWLMEIDHAAPAQCTCLGKYLKYAKIILKVSQDVTSDEVTLRFCNLKKKYSTWPQDKFTSGSLVYHWGELGGNVERVQSEKECIEKLRVLAQNSLRRV